MPRLQFKSARNFKSRRTRSVRGESPEKGHGRDSAASNEAACKHLRQRRVSARPPRVPGAIPFAPQNSRFIALVASGLSRRPRAEPFHSRGLPRASNQLATFTHIIRTRLSTQASFDQSVDRASRCPRPLFSQTYNLSESFCIEQPILPFRINLGWITKIFL